MKEEALQRMIDAVQRASPIIWQAAYRQVWIESFEYFCGAALFLVLCVVIFRHGQRFLLSVFEHPDSGDRLFIKFASYGVGGMMGIASFGLASEVLERAINPTFAAIKLLKGLI